MWAVLISTDIAGWHVVSRGDGGDVGYHWRGIK